MKIAIAAVHLEHVKRGIETWAVDTFAALAARGCDVTLFKGSGPSGVRERSIHSIKRDTRLSRLLVGCTPKAAWHIGLGSGNQLEELTFARSFLRRLQKEHFDVVHMQDAHAADYLRRAGLAGKHAARIVLAHGTEEPPSFLAPFQFLQHLAPYHMQECLAALGWGDEGERRDEGGKLKAEGGSTCGGKAEGDFRRNNASCVSPPPPQPSPFIPQPSPLPPPGWCALPNFVDTDVFRPAGASEKRRIRSRLEIPEDAFVVLSVAAVKKHHKRIDYLIREFESLLNWATDAPVAGDTGDRHPTSDLRPPLLLVAGAREHDTAELMAYAEDRLAGQARFLIDVPREQMPDILRAADVFALCSLKEMMPIALLEATASGLPCLVQKYPVEEWMIGPGGQAIDMSRKGALAEALRTYQDRTLRNDIGGKARQYAVDTFAKEPVIDTYIEMYERIMTLPLATPPLRP